MFWERTKNKINCPQKKEELHVLKNLIIILVI